MSVFLKRGVPLKRGGHLEICLEKEGTLDFEKGVTPFSLTIRVARSNLENILLFENIGTFENICSTEIMP